MAALKKWRESASLIIAAKSVLNVSETYNYKVLCIKRSSKSGFMPSTYVFPGGNKSKSDSNPKWLKVFENAGYNLNKLSSLEPKENVPLIFQHEGDEAIPKYLSLRLCALREIFEECGVLICNKNGSNDMDINWAKEFGGKEILEWQTKVHNDANEFINLCLHFNVVPNVWCLKLWNNWVTPPCYKALFDAVFFVTTFKQIPNTRAEEIEVQDIKWSDPDEYLLENKNEKLVLPPPQFYEMNRLRNFKNIEQFSTYIHERSLQGCETYFPYRIYTKEGAYSILPGDDLYPKVNDDLKKEGAKIDVLPDNNVMNRLLHKSEYNNNVLIKNFIPKAGHLPPLVTVFSKL